MGVKYSQLPIASEVAADDYVAVLDTSEGILKRTEVGHASTSTAYGVGSSTEFGHVKVSDTYSATVGGAADGVAASQQALHEVYTMGTAPATTATLGSVMPDGTTITVDQNGVISSQGGGHTIQDGAGTDLTQRSIMQIMGTGITATDDATGEKTIVESLSLPTWYGTLADWNQLSAAEKAKYKLVVTPETGTTPGISMFAIKNQTLTFSNLEANVLDNRVTEDTYILVFYDDDCIEEATDAGIISTSYNGGVLFTADVAPASTVTCDIVCMNM